MGVSSNNLVHLCNIESILLDSLNSQFSPRTIFILGAPRTGSTLLYQAMGDIFKLPFLSNFTNQYFSEFPIVGAALQKSLKFDIKWESKYGKTNGIFQPSEASAVLSTWFGGGHPSQEKSKQIIEGKEEHFLKTLNAIEVLYNQRPLLIKNAWNCFRVKYLAESLPCARFIWIRRDIASAAASDLQARYITKKSAFIWNSATPANWSELKNKQAHEQVVENQFEFNNAMQVSLNRYAHDRFVEIWYEKFIEFPVKEMKRLAGFLDLSLEKKVNCENIHQSDRVDISVEEMSAISTYIELNKSRLGKYIYNPDTQ